MHVMVDLETFSLRRDAAIISIGAVAFDQTGVKAEFKANVDPESAQAAGLHVDAGTVLWWFRQSQEARDRLRTPKPVHLAAALSDLDLFVEMHAGDDGLIWGNGATFDNVILANAYQAVGRPIPWHYTQDACYRTVANLFPHIQRVKVNGVAHDALDDARSQAEHLARILTAMRPLEVLP